MQTRPLIIVVVVDPWAGGQWHESDYTTLEQIRAGTAVACFEMNTYIKKGDPKLWWRHEHVSNQHSIRHLKHWAMLHMLIMDAR